ncbi:MAG: hypothetical protein ACI81T_000706, partial [Bacteroidia bacterium]
HTVRGLGSWISTIQFPEFSDSFQIYRLKY